MTEKRATVKSIVKEWLKSNGYDGLYHDDCGCGIGDLMPCDGGCVDCAPAYEYVATGREEEADVEKGGVYYAPEPSR